MKGLRLFFAVCLAPLVFSDANAVDNNDAARAAVRRTNNNVTSATTSRGTGGNAGIRDRTNTTTSRLQSINNQSTKPSITQRNAIAPSVTPRPATSVTSRSAKSSDINTTQARTAISARPGANASTTRRPSAKTISRAATTGTNATQSSNYKKCREVFNSCMDEFCANKDAQLKRCACSARIHEFDRVKKSLTDAEDKMLTFNQRLLTVNMDKEDATAMFTATEGENAFNAKDTSSSQKTLNTIAEKLKSTFSNSTLERNLSAISLSLNTDAAFDSLDSLQGTDTTAKSGTALYNAALPICREMAAEICTSDELDLAEGGYQMMIEQDCNTVKKSYQAQTDAARNKIREGSALLDMSRLDIHQKRNSDDVLTCKKKMLERLTDVSVCGSDMGKCLDVSGRYIDPSTGAAFLTVNLVNLGDLIHRPSNGETWTQAPGNSVFVSFLNSKKKYLEPAMESCQDISDTVWKEFIDDALAQIKLAQDKKLEDMRQGCTTLTTQCLTDAAKSLSDFDARALSIFGVTADKTATGMCADIKNACSALLNDNQNNTWSSGMTEIATDKSYDTILHTCREVGRACIIRTCKSQSGNFGLCENVETSVNRHSILTRNACWSEVLSCVASAGNNTITAIIDHNYPLQSTPTTSTSSFLSNEFYDKTYTNYAGIDDICSTDCTGNNTGKCGTCRIAEQLWGNCETGIESGTQYNRILTRTTEPTSTLLAWFAKNTGTETNNNSCTLNGCPPGQEWHWSADGGQVQACFADEDVDSCDRGCNHETDMYYPLGQGNGNIKFCCATQPIKDNNDTITICPATNTNIYDSITFPYPGTTHTGQIYVPKPNKPILKYGDYMLFCVGDNPNTNPDDLVEASDDTNNYGMICHGHFVWVDNQNHYMNPIYTNTNSTGDNNFVQHTYYKNPNNSPSNCTDTTGNNLCLYTLYYNANNNAPVYPNPTETPTGCADWDNTQAWRIQYNQTTNNNPGTQSQYSNPTNFEPGTNAS